jgi:hypothetical protein
MGTYPKLIPVVIATPDQLLNTLGGTFEQLIN